MPTIRSKSRRFERGGYTLVEIMVVVVLLGIIAAVVVPMAVSGSSMEAVSAARNLASDIQYAQSMAITRQESMRVVFDAAGESYSLRDYESTPLIHPMTKTDYIVTFSGHRALGNVDLVTADFGGDAVLIFDETGAPDSAGTATVSAENVTYQISVSAGTGRVTVTDTDS